MKIQKCYITNDGTVFLDKKDATVYEREAEALTHFEQYPPPDNLDGQGTLSYFNTHEKEILNYFGADYEEEIEVEIEDPI